MVSIFGIIAILIFVFWIVVQITGNPGDSERVQTAAVQPVRLGAAPISAPKLHPRSGQSATEVEPRPVIDDPVLEKPLEQADLASNSGNVPEELPPQPMPEAQVNDIAAQEVNDIAALENVAAPESSEADLAMVDIPLTELASDAPSSDTLSLAPPPATEIPPTEPFLPTQEETEPSVLLDLAPPPVIVNATLTRSIAPRYPDQCTRNAAPLETVTIIFDVTIKGRAANARVVRTSNACFDNAAMATIRRWRFDPKTVDGTPRPDIGKQATLNFRR